MFEKENPIERLDKIIQSGELSEDEVGGVKVWKLLPHMIGGFMIFPGDNEYGVVRSFQSGGMILSETSTIDRDGLVRQVITMQIRGLENFPTMGCEPAHGSMSADLKDVPQNGAQRFRDGVWNIIGSLERTLQPPT